MVLVGSNLTERVAHSQLRATSQLCFTRTTSTARKIRASITRQHLSAASLLMQTLLQVSASDTSKSLIIPIVSYTRSAAELHTIFLSPNRTIVMAPDAKDG